MALTREIFRKNGVKYELPARLTLLNGYRYPLRELARTPEGLTRLNSLGITRHLVEEYPNPDIDNYTENPDGSLVIAPKTQAELDTLAELNRNSNKVVVNEKVVGSVHNITSVSGELVLDLSVINDFECTLTESTNLSLPLYADKGQRGFIRFVQDNTTPFVVTFDSSWVSANNVAGVMSQTLGASNLLTYIVEIGGADPIIVYNWITKGIA